MGVVPLEQVSEELIQLDFFQSDQDESGDDRVTRTSTRRPRTKFYGRSRSDRHAENHVPESFLRRRMSVSGWGSPRLIRVVFASTFGFFLAMVLFRTLLSTAWFDRRSADEFDEVFSGTSHLFSSASNPRRENFLRNVLPVPCHSHNDYWRRTPLYAALGSGCISVEADVWLIDDDLFVGHDIGTLTREITLKSMYLKPLERVLRAMNTESEIGNVSTNGRHGVFSLDPDQTLVLLVDFKTSGPSTFAKVEEQLQDLRDADWLTYWNGSHRVERPITVVATGNAPFGLIAANDRYRDIFYDAPLSSLASDGDPAAPTPTPGVRTGLDNPSHPGPNVLRYKYNPSNSWYASSDYKAAGGVMSVLGLKTPPTSSFGDYIRTAEVRGLVPRYWNTPRWPRTFRDQIWEMLLEEGVGVLNVDDLRAARKGNWGKFDWGKRAGGRDKPS